MALNESPKEIVKEAYPSQIISIVMNFIVGIILTIFIYRNAYFFVIVIMIPPLLSVRGNISGSFTARTARDLLIGDFNRDTIFQNIIATVFLTLIIALLIGIGAWFLAQITIPNHNLHFEVFLLLPLITLFLTSVFSIPCSIFLNYFVFKKGYSPNTVVPPIMTTIDDIIIVSNIYFCLILLKVGI